MQGPINPIKYLFIVFFLLLSLFVFPMVQEGAILRPADTLNLKERENISAESSTFDAGKMIMEHVTDAHEWHICKLGTTNITIPLPVILLCEGKLYIFLSNKFHNPSHAYKEFAIAEEGPDKGKIVKLKPDKITGNGPPVYDFSITKTAFAILFSSILLIIIFLSVATAYETNKGKAPKGLQNAMEPLILFVRDDVAKSSIGDKRYERYVPYLLTIFFFIFFNNLLGIIPIFPGGANVTGNIAVTGVMAVCTLVITSFSANRHYWIDIVNTPGVPWWLKLPVPLMPVVEFMSVLTKPFVLMVRLFANMLAGHIVILGFISIIFIFGAMTAALGYGVSIVSLVFMVFMDLLEVLVALIQAYVFTLLSALYFGLAAVEPEHHKQ
jgi:F-type H+-transporting ATPase subunit a